MLHYKLHFEKRRDDTILGSHIEYFKAKSLSLSTVSIDTNRTRSEEINDYRAETTYYFNYLISSSLYDIFYLFSLSIYLLYNPLQRMCCCDHDLLMEQSKGQRPSNFVELHRIPYRTNPSNKKNWCMESSTLQRKNSRRGRGVNKFPILEWSAIRNSHQFKPAPQKLPILKPGG